MGGFTEWISFLTNNPGFNGMTLFLKQKNIEQIEGLQSVDKVEARFMLDYLVRCSSLEEMTFADLTHRLVVESNVVKEIRAAEEMLKKIESQEQLLEAQIAAKQL